MHAGAGVGAVGGRGQTLGALAGGFAGLAGQLQNGVVETPPQMQPLVGFAGVGGRPQNSGGGLPPPMQAPDGSAGMAGDEGLHAAFRALARGSPDLPGFLARVAREVQNGKIGFAPPVHPGGSVTGLPGPYTFGRGGVPSQMQPTGQVAGVQAWRNAAKNFKNE